MLSVERMKTLEAIATHGSVGGAAAALHLTTSAVSQQMAKLEDEIGQVLLERQGRGVRLTDAAEVLVAHARRILRLVEAAESDLEARRGKVAGSLRLGAFASAVRGIAAPAVRTLTETYPELVVRLEEVEPDESVRMVERGVLDVAVLQDWLGSALTLPEALERAPLLDDVADIALPADHPLAERHGVLVGEVAGESWIGFLAGPVCHDWLVDTVRAQGCEPRIGHKASEYASHLELVAAGLGITVIPRLGRTAIPAGVRLVAVDPPLRRHVYGAWRADAARRPAIRAVIAALQAAAEPLAATASPLPPTQQLR
jgi:DNA-binding transcriptional LysR family regulator